MKQFSPQGGDTRRNANDEGTCQVKRWGLKVRFRVTS